MHTIKHGHEHGEHGETNKC